MKGFKMENHNTSGGISFSGLLTVIFIMLKLLGKINWSWWWVLSPIWIPIFIVIILVIILAVIEQRMKS
jgi:hypothetical protein